MTCLVFLLRVVFVAFLPVAVFAGAKNLDSPVLLEIEVRDGAGNEGIILQYTIEDLQALPVVSFDTETIWYTGPQNFTGVSLEVLMQKVGATTGTLEVSASDDFTRQISLATVVEFRAIIAYARNGRLMSVRRKGPLRMVYPYDEFSSLERDVLFTNTIWQLVRIVVKPEDM